MHADDMGMIERGDQGWNRKAKPDRVTAFGKNHHYHLIAFRQIRQTQSIRPDIFVENGYDLSTYGFRCESPSSAWTFEGFDWHPDGRRQLVLW